MFYFGSVFEKNSDSIRNELVGSNKCSLDIIFIFTTYVIAE